MLYDYFVICEQVSIIVFMLGRCYCADLIVEFPDFEVVFIYLKKKRLWTESAIFFQMSRFDMVVFGATGFTGRRAVQEVARVSKKYGPLTWAIAGRSEKKLQDVLSEASNKTGKLSYYFSIYYTDMFTLN